MDLDELFNLCTEFTNLGWAVHEQLGAVIDGEDIADQNPNAMRLCCKFLASAHQAGIEGAQDLKEKIEAAIK